MFSALPRAGVADGTVVAWQPPVLAEEGEEEREGAVWRVLHDDGDVEDLEADELEEGFGAWREGRGLEGEVELLMEASWEALEMSVALLQQPGSALQLAEAHERLGDAALQNEQPERALQEYTAARALLTSLVHSGSLPKHHRRVADVELYLGITQLQLGRLGEARGHYKQAIATLRLRCATLERAKINYQIEMLEREVGRGGGEGSEGDMGVRQTSAEMDAEKEELAGLSEEIEARLRELQDEV